MYGKCWEMIGQRLMFRQITRRNIARVKISYRSLSTSTHHGMGLFKQTAALPSLVVEAQGQESLNGRDYHRQRRTTWFLQKEGFKKSDTERRLCAICGNKAPAGKTVSNWIRSCSTVKATHLRLSMSGIGAPLKNGSVKPSRNSEGDRSDVQHMRENAEPQVT
jgi:hypothetical protein